MAVAVMPVIVMSSSSSMVVGIVTMRVMVISVVTVMRRSYGHLEVVPCHICENTVLNVSSQQTLFGERVAVFLGVDSPSHVSSEEKRAVVSDCDVLIEVVFKQLLGLSRCHYYFSFINYKS